MKFSQMIFYVKDVRKTLDFYEKAFGFKTKFIHESGTYGELDTGTTALGFANQELSLLNLPDGCQHYDKKKLPFASEIVFSSENLKKDYEHALKAGATLVQEPIEKPWGEHVGYLRDQDGILIEMASEMETAPIA